MERRRVQAVLSLLSDGGWWTVTDLVRRTATSRRAIETLLLEIGAERSADSYRVSGDALPTGGYRPFAAADPVAHLLPEHAHVVARLAELISDGPGGRPALDHVAATPETVVRRALLFGARFWPPDSAVLCVGDHDLTSFAIAMIHPGARVTVVDIDERILAYIDRQAERLGLHIRTRWADLRIGLPPSVRHGADLAITDPPYSPDGVGLFVARAAEGLRESGGILLAYGASERTPALAQKVQASLQDLNLVFEAIYPDFNRYFGAEAIGSASDLYVLRPTRTTGAAVAARVARFSPAIYTQGPQAVEASTGGDFGAGFGPGFWAGFWGGFEAGLLVGEWPRDVAPRVPRVRLATWLAKPYAAAPERVAIAVPGGLEAALPRLLLAARADHVRVLLGGGPAAADLGALRAALSPVYEISARESVVDALRKPPAGDDPLRMILDRAHGKLANTWREALIRMDGNLTKRRAAEIVAKAAPWAGDVTPLELPLHRLLALGPEVRESAGS